MAGSRQQQQPRIRHRRTRDVAIIVEHSTPIVTETITILPPNLEPVTCHECGVDMPQGLSFAVIKHVGSIGVETRPACSQVCADAIRDKWLGKGEVAPSPEQHDETTPTPTQPDSDTTLTAEPLVVDGQASIVDDVPTQLVNVALVELRAIAASGNAAAEEWLNKIESVASEGTRRQLFVIGDMKLRLLSDPRAEARYVYSVLFQ